MLVREVKEDREITVNMRTSNYEPWDYEGESGSPELDDMHERRGGRGHSRNRAVRD
jgi:hypothetical protein